MYCWCYLVLFTPCLEVALNSTLLKWKTLARGTWATACFGCRYAKRALVFARTLSLPPPCLFNQWQWSFRDVLAIANLIQLGATFNSISMMGNEPLFTVSFAAGVALKMFIGECMPAAMAKQINNLLSEAQVTLASQDEEVVRSFNGIGACGGGVFRCLFGDTSIWGAQGPAYAAMAAQFFLLILPMLNASQVR
jgi:hypothetical protein